MKRYVSMILAFTVGFYGTGLILNDPPEILLMKANVMFYAVVLSSTMLLYDLLRGKPKK